MGRSIPTVRNGSLQQVTSQGIASEDIPIGSEAWYVWLEQHDSFGFETQGRVFTARKEQRSSSGWYWYAYRRHGKLHTSYLGKARELTLERLNTVAEALERASTHNESAFVGTIKWPLQVPGGDPLHVHQTTLIPFPSTLTLAEQLTAPEPAPKHNLPLQLTSLIGREQDALTAEALLRSSEVHLLSMVGTAGIGKTRLAIQVAIDLLDDFADGIYFVSLTPIRDPELVLFTIAQSFELKENASEPIADRLKIYLQSRHLLLVLDNFEQVISAAPLLIELLLACPKVKLLVTSREVLHLSAEQQFSVPPLALPDLKHPPPAESFSQYAAVELFTRRAQAVKPDFHLTNANAVTIATICTRLDGLPLALELAAARVKHLSLQALLARLEHRLDLLLQGPRDAHIRQQTLRNTIQWSYDLLSDEEQALWRRLAVFVGGCTLEAAEVVCQTPHREQMNVFDGVASLIDKNVVYQKEQRDGERRLFMLETIREYGWECLLAHEEAEAIQNAHAAYFLASAKKATHFDQLEQEHDNLRAALRWSIEQAEVVQNNEMALQLSEALNWFWLQRGYLSEGRQWLERTLAGSERTVTSQRAWALYTTGRLAYHQDDFAQAEQLTKEALTCFQELGDKHGMALSLRRLGTVARTKHNYQVARVLIEESVAILREEDNKVSLAFSLCDLTATMSRQGELTRARVLAEEGLIIAIEEKYKEAIAPAFRCLAEVLFFQGEYASAYTVAEKGLAIARELNMKWRIAWTLELLGQIGLHQKDRVAACSLFEESLTVYRELGSRWSIAKLLVFLASIATFQGEEAKARDLCEESLANFKSGEDQELLASFLEDVAEIIVVQGGTLWAAHLWGAAEVLREAMGIPLLLDVHSSYKRAVACVRMPLGKEAFATAWAEGRTLSPEQAIVIQGRRISPTPAPTGQSSRIAKSASTYPAGLTVREVEVLRLVANGLTDTQVAERLVISYRTVTTHLNSIYNKLGVTSRTSATRFAVEHQLV